MQAAQLNSLKETKKTHTLRIRTITITREKKMKLIQLKNLKCIWNQCIAILGILHKSGILFPYHRRELSQTFFFNHFNLPERIFRQKAFKGTKAFTTTALLTVNHIDFSKQVRLPQEWVKLVSIAYKHTDKLFATISRFQKITIKVIT